MTLIQIFLTLLLFAPAHSDEVSATKPMTITWAFTSSSELKPSSAVNILSENHPLIRVFRQGLPEYNHQSFVATIPRIEIELQGKNLVCYAGSSEAERRKKFSYLTSEYVQPSPRLITKRSTARELLKKSKNGIFLTEVLADKKLKGLIGENRSFGNKLDQILNESSNPISTKVFDDFGPSVFQMIEKGRADYTIEYPFVLENLKESKKVGPGLVAIPLVEAGPSITQYLACSKTPEGLAVIKKVDKIIRENVRKSDYWTSVLKSMPASDRLKFQKEIDQFVELRAKNPVIIQ